MVREDPAFFGKEYEIGVAGEKFFGIAAVTVVECVQEVEADGSRDQFEPGRARPGCFRSLLDVSLLCICQPIRSIHYLTIKSILTS